MQNLGANKCIMGNWKKENTVTSQLGRSQPKSDRTIEKSYRSKAKVTLLHVQKSVSKVRPSSLQIKDLEHFSFFKRKKNVTWLGAI